MDRTELLGWILVNEFNYKDETADRVREKIRKETGQWSEKDWNYLFRRLTVEAFSRSKVGSERQIFYLELTSYVLGLQDGRLGL